MFQKDLATAIVVAVIGVVMAYFVTGLFVKNDNNASESVKTVDTSVSADVDEPNPEVFNYKALNPTVEVYVGNCDENGNCDETVTETEIENIINNSTNRNNTSNNSSSINQKDS